MAGPIFCNVCFQKPQGATLNFSLTNCGHVICGQCLQKAEIKIDNPPLALPYKPNLVAEMVYEQNPGKEGEEISRHHVSCNNMMLNSDRYCSRQVTSMLPSWVMKRLQTNNQAQRASRTPQFNLELHIFSSNGVIEAVLEFLGTKDECMICRAPCRTIVLSKKVNSDIQSLFMGLDGLCRKYSKEVTQIAQFQEKHRRRLLAHYREKITKLETYLKKASQQIQHIQQLQHWDSSKEVEVPPSVRKTETVAGPTRISLISPPQNGHMGSVTCRSSQLSGMTLFQKKPPGSIRSSPLKMLSSGNSYMSPFVSSQNSRSHISNTFGVRSTQHYQSTSSSLSSGIKHPITLVNLLQRQHLGSTNLPGHSLQK